MSSLIERVRDEYEEFNSNTHISLLPGFLSCKMNFMCDLLIYLSENKIPVDEAEKLNHAGITQELFDRYMMLNMVESREYEEDPIALSIKEYLEINPIKDNEVIR